jgi:hypothetical protein
MDVPNAITARSRKFPAATLTVVVALFTVAATSAWDPVLNVTVSGADDAPLVAAATGLAPLTMNPAMEISRLI